MSNAEKIEITYTLQGDYYLPNLTLPPQPMVELGEYADLRCDFLENHYEIIYYDLLTDCKLVEHLAQIEQEALELEETLTEQMMKEQGVTEQLKAEDQMTWVGKMNNIKSSVREIVLNEVIYRI